MPDSVFYMSIKCVELPDLMLIGMTVERADLVKRRYEGELVTKDYHGHRRETPWVAYPHPEAATGTDGNSFLLEGGSHTASDRLRFTNSILDEEPVKKYIAEALLDFEELEKAGARAAAAV